jgi:hypothetical protein
MYNGGFVKKTADKGSSSSGHMKMELVQGFNSG